MKDISVSVDSEGFIRVKPNTDKAMKKFVIFRPEDDGSYLFMKMESIIRYCGIFELSFEIINDENNSNTFADN